MDHKDVNPMSALAPRKQPSTVMLNEKFLLQTGLGLPMSSVSPSQLLFLLLTAVGNGSLTVQRAGDVLMRVGN